MFEPKYLIRLSEKSFSAERFACLGSQLKVIIQSLSKLIEAHVWFCADIDAVSSIPEKLGIDSFQLKKIKDDHSLINLCENVEQFLSGVFIAVKEKNQDFKYPELRAGTEDEQFRPLDQDGILIEIRAFDTSYFELYSENRALMQKLSEIYGIEIETAETLS